MLHNAKELNGYKLNSIDGEIGRVKEFYFDDRHWTVRYLVADTGSWLQERQVLISPYSLAGVNTIAQHITVDLTRKQIEESPSLNSDKPVSRQFEDSFHGYYGYPEYWVGSYIWGTYPDIVRDREKWNAFTKDDKAWDPSLRSTQEVSGHHIQAADGEIGHVEDFIIDEKTWAIRYLIIDTKNWWAGKKVLVSPQWIDHISWDESKVFIKLPCEVIRQSPEYSETALLTREYETRLYQHYNRMGYWAEKSVPR
ncbi:MAG: PRC-barrel domain-containing protein [Proteobacteria bacterium]|nr:PRC-barrel domain-containing protein [Pseudomonadota bacterium]